jgi:hypothetical protein
VLALVSGCITIQNFGSGITSKYQPAGEKEREKPNQSKIKIIDEELPCPGTISLAGLS